MYSNSEIAFYIFYKLLVILGSLIIAYWGYKLFNAGLTSKAGNLKFSFGDFKLEINRSAPGIFFLVIGGLVFLFSTYRGIELKSNEKKSLYPIPEHLDSTHVTRLTGNIDSIYTLALESYKENKWILCYKYLYYVRGLAISDSSHDLSKIDSLIGIVDIKSSIPINNQPIIFEQTRSSKVAHQLSDSLRN